MAATDERIKQHVVGVEPTHVSNHTLENEYKLIGVSSTYFSFVKQVKIDILSVLLERRRQQFTAEDFRVALALLRKLPIAFVITQRKVANRAMA